MCIRDSTHSEPRPQFDARYRERSTDIAAWLDAFDADALRAWAQGLGAVSYTHLDVYKRQRTRRDTELKTVLGEVLPKRFAQRLCEHWIQNKPLRQYTPAELRSIAELLAAWPLIASGSEGYRTAEVTLGGVDTDGLSSSTLQSKTCLLYTSRCV